MYNYVVRNKVNLLTVISQTNQYLGHVFKARLRFLRTVIWNREATKPTI